MSTKTPARQSKRARGLDVSPGAPLTVPKGKRAVPASGSAIAEEPAGDDMTDAPTYPPAPPADAPPTSGKSKRKLKQQPEEIAPLPHESENAPAVLKSKRSKKDTDSNVPFSPTFPVSSASASLSSVSALLDSDVSPSADAVATAADLRTIQQVIIKMATSSNAAQLMNVQLWNGFLTRLQVLQSNTVRIDLHLLTAIGRSFSEAVVARSFAVLPTLRSLLSLLLPSTTTPAAASWSTTFRPSYDYFLGFLSGVVRTLVSVDANQMHADGWTFFTTVLDAFTLLNEAQNAQRKVYDAALQERALPVWAQLHLQIEESLRPAGSIRLSSDAHDSAQSAAEKLEFVIGQATIPSTSTSTSTQMHLAIPRQRTRKTTHTNQRQPTKKKMNEDASIERGSGCQESQSDRLQVKGTNVLKPAVHKPHPANYTRKLFEAVEGWITREETSGGGETLRRHRHGERTVTN